MEPNWLQVLDAWVAQPSNPPKVGLSLPFLFGATRTPIGAKIRAAAAAESQFFELLDSIQQYRYDGKQFAIKRCNHVSGHLILSAEDAVGGNGGLVFYLGGLTPAEARSLVWRESRESILEGNYSFYDGEFRPLSDADLRLISNALA
jgi:hypothetical protein